MAEITRGDLFWLAVPRPGSDPDLEHPHVVISDQALIDSRLDTVVVCALTTNLRRANEPGNVLLDEGEGDLPRRSVLVCSQVSTVQKGRLTRRIGRLDAARVDQVYAGLRFQQRSR